MRLKIVGGKIGTVIVDEEIDIASLSGKLSALRTMSPPPGLEPAERARLEQLFPIEQYDPDTHAPGRNINGR